MIPTREGLRDQGPQLQLNLQHQRGRREPARKALNVQQMVHFKKTDPKSADEELQKPVFKTS